MDGDSAVNSVPEITEHRVAEEAAVAAEAVADKDLEGESFLISIKNLSLLFTATEATTTAPEAATDPSALAGDPLSTGGPTKQARKCSFSRLYHTLSRSCLLSPVY